MQGNRPKPSPCPSLAQRKGGERIYLGDGSTNMSPLRCWGVPRQARRVGWKDKRCVLRDALVNCQAMAVAKGLNLGKE